MTIQFQNINSQSKYSSEYFGRNSVAFEVIVSAFDKIKEVKSGSITHINNCLTTTLISISCIYNIVSHVFQSHSRMLRNDSRTSQSGSVTFGNDSRTSQSDSVTFGNDSRTSRNGSVTSGNDFGTSGNDFGTSRNCLKRKYYFKKMS